MFEKNDYYIFYIFTYINYLLKKIKFYIFFFKLTNNNLNYNSLLINEKIYYNIIHHRLIQVEVA